LRGELTISPLKENGEEGTGGKGRGEVQFLKQKSRKRDRSGGARTIGSGKDERRKTNPRKIGGNRLRRIKDLKECITLGSWAVGGEQLGGGKRGCQLYS